MDKTVEIKLGPWTLKRTSTGSDNRLEDELWLLTLGTRTHVQHGTREELEPKELVMNGVEVNQLTKMLKMLAIVEMKYFISPHETQV